MTNETDRSHSLTRRAARVDPRVALRYEYGPAKGDPDHRSVVSGRKIGSITSHWASLSSHRPRMQPVFPDTENSEVGSITIYETSCR
jgi:hypothetical protein